MNEMLNVVLQIQGKAFNHPLLLVLDAFSLLRTCFATQDRVDFFQSIPSACIKTGQVVELNRFAIPIFDVSEVSVGQHFYWQIGDYQVHGQVLITSWIVFGLIGLLSLSANRNLKSTPDGLQNLTEFVTEFIRDLAKTQIGEEEYLKWVPFLGTIFLFIFVSNWSGALLPWRLIELPNGELAAPTNDINTTVALALLTSIAYFYAGLRKKGLGYFKRYIEPAAFLLPINILEDFTKPLSLSFRLFGNILADELVVGVLIALVPLVVPIPLMLLGLFTSAIQALVFATLAGAYIGEALEGH